ncbi:MAG: hypothetical protein ABH842_05685 [Candidatus Micrarchaeota archaeon]
MAAPVVKKPPQATSEALAERNARLIETTLPLSLQQKMGMYWQSFKYELGYILQEYNTTPADIKKYLEDNGPRIERAIGTINEKFRDRNQEKLNYIVTSLFVSAHLHGLEPSLLLALCDQESDFDFKSGAGGVGILQLTSRSAIMELMHPDQDYRERKREQLQEQLERFGGQEFVGVVRAPRVQRTDGRITVDRQDMEYLYHKRALYNAVWAARTFLLKGVDRNRYTERSELRDIERLRQLFEDYNGSSNKVQYATDVLALYAYYSGEIDRRRLDVIPKK